MGTSLGTYYIMSSKFKVDFAHRAETIQVLHGQLQQLVCVTLQNHRALDLLTAEKGVPVCSWEKFVVIMLINHESFRKKSTNSKKEVLPGGNQPQPI